MPVDRTAASGTKVKADLPLCTLDISGIEFFRTFNANLRFFEVYAGVHDCAGPPLASLGVADIHDNWFSTNRGTK